MANGPTTRRDVTLPAELLRELAPDARVRERVAEEYGRRLAEGILRSDDPPRSVSVFWTRLSDALGARGWGSIAHRRAHPGLGVVTSDSWAEADAGGDGGVGGGHGGCPFGVGILHGALATVAGGRKVRVIEAACRGDGAERCTFAFGSPRAVQQVGDALARGLSLDEAVETLER